MLEFKRFIFIWVLVGLVPWATAYANESDEPISLQGHLVALEDFDGESDLAYSADPM